MVAHHKMSMPFNKWITLPSPNSCLSEWRTRQVNLKRCIARKNRNVKVFPPQPEDVTIVAPIFCFHMPTSHIYLKEICQSQQQKGKERNCFHPANAGRQSPRVKDGVVQVEMKTEQGEKGEEGGSFILRLSGRK